MKQIMIIALGIMLHSVCCSQSCLPEGIIFTTQSQIDSFQINYPGCQRIEGNVKVQGTGIWNLHGLSQLRGFGADLVIRNCDSLIRLTGLDSVTHIGGTFSILYDPMMRELDGINALDTIGGPLILSNNEKLEHINALQNLTYIGSSIGIHSNPKLKNLDGLDSVRSFARYIYIDYNYTLEDIHGLGGIYGAEAYIKVEGNPRLKNLEGLEGIRTIMGELIIYQNDSLISLKGLDHVDSLFGAVEITLNQQLLSLDALKQVQQIGGLYVSSNESLEELKGFNSLTTITDYCSFFNNPAMVTLEGLENLCSIGGNLYICGGGYTNLDALSLLDSIGGFGHFWICGNIVLTNISGIGNIAPHSIKDLHINDNPLLLICDIDNICTYLASPDAESEIHDNGIGCNSVQEVEGACKMDLEEYGSFALPLSIYPNPTSNHITIELAESLTQNNITKLSIFNINGQCIMECKNTEPQTVLDISDLNTGIYFIKAIGQNNVLVKKLVVN